MLDIYEPQEEFHTSHTPIGQSAAHALKNHFFNVRGDPIKTPYFLKQLQVLYENDYFPWIVNDALKLLESQGIIQSFTQDTIKGVAKLKHLSQIKFFINSMTATNVLEFERLKSRAYNICKIVNQYSHPEITSYIGKHLQTLVWHELRAQGFKIVSQNTNEYNGKKWIQSGRDLDFIAEHNSGKLIIGVEVKNTLDIIRIEELNDKLEMCKFLGITPVFAVRWNKPYIQTISKKGGYSWNFKTWIYPKPYHKLVNRIFVALSVTNRKDNRGHPLKFPIIDRDTLPEKPVSNFQKWIMQKVGSY